MLDLDFIETCYSEAQDDARWGIALCEAMAVMESRSSAGVMCASYEVEAEPRVRLLTLAGEARYMARDENLPSSSAFVREMNGSPTRELQIRATYGASNPTVTVLSELSAEQQTSLRPHLPWPEGDILGLFGILDGVHGFVLSTGGPEARPPSRRRRVQLSRLCEHIAVGYWLRSLRPTAQRVTNGDVDAVYAPDGRRLDHAGRPVALDDEARLVDAVRSMDRSRCRRQKRSPDEATELWQALVAGSYALVESFDRGGQRVILAVRCRTGRPALTPRELAVTSAAARGLPNKLIAAELGISSSTVAVHLGMALRKLGCPSRRELPSWLSGGRGNGRVNGSGN